MLNVFQVQKYAPFSFERHSSFFFREAILGEIPYETNYNLKKSVVWHSVDAIFEFRI